MLTIRTKVDSDTMQQVNESILQEFSGIDAGALSHLLDLSKSSVMTLDYNEFSEQVQDAFMKLSSIAGMLRVKQMIEPEVIV